MSSFNKLMIMTMVYRSHSRNRPRPASRQNQIGAVAVVEEEMLAVGVQDPLHAHLSP